MPTYAYACTACGHAFEIVQSFSDDSLSVCPECEGRLRKVFSSVGVVFKGSGLLPQRRARRCEVDRPEPRGVDACRDSRVDLLVVDVLGLVVVVLVTPSSAAPQRSPRPRPDASGLSLSASSPAGGGADLVRDDRQRGVRRPLPVATAGVATATARRDGTGVGRPAPSRPQPRRSPAAVHTAGRPANSARPTRLPSAVMHPHLLAGRPPPLPHRRRPFPLALRATLWRARFAVGAVFLGLAAACTVQALRPADPPTTPVLVAAHALAAGTRADQRRRPAWSRFPVAVVPDGALTDPDAVVDASTAVPLAAGTPVLPGLLADDEVRGPPGTVVATVRFADPAVAGLLSPGMRVDVLAATPEGGPGGVVATRALVLPVARRTASHASALGLGGSGDDSVPVLLAVSPDEAPALAGAAASALLSAVVVP